MRRPESKANHVHLVSRSTMICQYFYTITILLRVYYTRRNTMQTPFYTRITENCHELNMTFEVKTETIIFLYKLNLFELYPNTPFCHLAMLRGDNNALSFARRKHRYPRGYIVISGNWIHRLRFLFTYLFVQLLRRLSAPYGRSVNLLWTCAL